MIRIAAAVVGSQTRRSIGAGSAYGIRMERKQLWCASASLTLAIMHMGGTDFRDDSATVLRGSELCTRGRSGGSRVRVRKLWLVYRVH